MVKKKKAVKKPTKALAVRKPKTSALVDKSRSAMPDYLKEKMGSGRGMEKIDKSKLIMPRLKLLQKMSPEVEEGMTEGTILNSVTKENYGEDLFFIPITYFQNRTCFRDRDAGGGIMCSSQDTKTPKSEADANKAIEEMADSKRIKLPKLKKGQKAPVVKTCDICPLKDWNDDAKIPKFKKPVCDTQDIFPIIIEGESVPVAMAFGGTKVKVAREFLTMTSYTPGGLDIFAKRYKLSTVKETNKAGNTYFNFHIEPAGFASEEEFKMAEELYDAFKNLNLGADGDVDK